MSLANDMPRYPNWHEGTVPKIVKSFAISADSNSALGTE